MKTMEHTASTSAVSRFLPGSWKQRVRLLQAGIAVLLPLIYLLAIRPTLRLRSEYQLRQQEAASGQEAMVRLQSLRSKAASHAGTVATPPADDDRPERAGTETGRLLLLAQEQGIHLLSLPEAQQFIENGMQITCSSYGFEGTFSSLLRFLHALEEQEAIHIAHLSFQKQSHPLTRQPRLCLQVQTAALQATTQISSR